MKAQQTKRLTVTAVLLALATVLALICALIPFIHLPMGGGFTVASMLPIVIISYMYGVKWGLFASFTYSVIQIVMDLCLGVNGSTIMALFMPQSEDYMGMVAAVAILVIDYFVAYTLLGLGGIFRNKVKNQSTALMLGSITALSARYLAHIFSGWILFSGWAEWFFTQDGFPAWGAALVGNLSANALGWVYSIVYNGMYMLPEMILTAVAAMLLGRISQIVQKIN